MKTINGFTGFTLDTLVRALFSLTGGHTHNGTDSRTLPLANGKVNVGNGSGLAVAVTLSGDVTTTNAGVTSIGAAKVTKAKMNIYISAERTATGAEETVAHGLVVAPAHVLIIPTDTAPATAGVFTVTEGAHTTTNVLVTVTSGKKYKIVALA